MSPRQLWLVGAVQPDSDFLEVDENYGNDDDGSVANEDADEEVERVVVPPNAAYLAPHRGVLH